MIDWEMSFSIDYIPENDSQNNVVLFSGVCCYTSVLNDNWRKRNSDKVKSTRGPIWPSGPLGPPRTVLTLTLGIPSDGHGTLGQCPKTCTAGPRCPSFTLPTFVTVRALPTLTQTCIWLKRQSKPPELRSRQSKGYSFSLRGAGGKKKKNVINMRSKKDCDR